jgi:hypothetical protein
MSQNTFYACTANVTPLAPAILLLFCPCHSCMADCCMYGWCGSSSASQFWLSVVQALSVLGQIKEADAAYAQVQSLMAMQMSTATMLQLQADMGLSSATRVLLGSLNTLVAVVVQVAEGSYGVDITTYAKAAAAAEVLPGHVVKQASPLLHLLPAHSTLQLYGFSSGATLLVRSCVFAQGILPAIVLPGY